MSLGGREFDGVGVNLANSQDHLGGHQDWATSLMLEYAPSGQWHITGAARASRDRMEHPNVATATASDYNCGSQDAVSGYWSYYCGDLPLTDRFDISPEVPESVIRTLQFSLGIERTAELWSVDSFTAYYRSTSDAYRDFDGSSAGGLFGVCTVNLNCNPVGGLPRVVNRLVLVNQVNRDSGVTEEFSQEFRLRSVADRFDWMLGAPAFLTRGTATSAIGAGPVDLGTTERLTAVLPATPLRLGTKLDLEQIRRYRFRI